MKKILFGIMVLLLPVLVNAEVTKDTKAIGTDIYTDSTIENQVNSEIAKNSSLTNVTNGYYIEGLKVNCTNGKNQITYVNQKLTTSITCANGNNNPYNEVIANGATSFENSSSCTDSSNAPYAYATRVLAYDCAYILGEDKTSKVEYTANNNSSTNNNTSNNNSGSSNPTTKPTGTTNNSNTGIEDYFIVLGSISLAVVGCLYFVDKKNVFKGI